MTAILTAYYMTRQVIMVFFGEAKWDEARPEADTASDHEEDHHSVKPHESPWIMLAAARRARRALDGRRGAQPADVTRWLDHWLEPVVGDAERTLTVPTSGKWILVIAHHGGGDARHRRRLAGVPAQAGQGDRAADPRPRVVLRRGGHRLHGWPGRDAFEGAAWFDANVVDGAVNGTATVVKESAGVVRKSESGYVRGYAAVIGIGVVLVLGWFLFKGLV